MTELSSFLKLPVLEMAPSGRFKTDIYVTFRVLTFEADPPPVLAIAINPQARSLQTAIPVLERYPTAGSAFRRFATEFYKTFLRFDHPHRPAHIMVDDPVFCAFLNTDLRDSGTTVRVVNDETELIEEGGIKPSSMNEPARLPLVAIASQMVLHVQEQILADHRGSRGDSSPPPGRPNLANVLTPIPMCPKILRTCGAPSCGKLLPLLKACLGCKKAWYCGVPCQKAAWSKHKPSCRK
jgi:hypothetical protein